MSRQFTAIIYPDDGLYTALCPELDIASGGDTVEAARANLTEALELFLEDASPEEIEAPLRRPRAHHQDRTRCCLSFGPIPDAKSAASSNSTDSCK